MPSIQLRPLLATVLLALAGGTAWAAEVPPADAKPLSQVLEAVEKDHPGVIISADFDEILEMSDRILVCFEGQIMGEYSGKNPPIEEISLAMTGK